MLTVVSITSVSLWENQIPNKILEYLYTNTSFKNIMEIQYIPRHHSEVLHIFIHFYGQYLDTCPYAKLFSFPDKYAMFYRVEQAPCYKSCKYPERVVLFNTGAAQKYPEVAGSQPLPRIDIAQPIDWDRLAEIPDARGGNGGD